MDKRAIEQEVRRLQVEIYGRREVRYPLGVPDIPTLFDPRNVADHCALHFEVRERLDTDFAGGGEAAGIWRRDRSTILISSRYSFEIQRFTAAHEIGHYILHPFVGDRTLHREMATDGTRTTRSELEREADYFAACLLMPRRAVLNAVTQRFGKTPLVPSETLAFYLHIDTRTLFSAPRGSLEFAKSIARARINGHRSLAEHFGVSAGAMAIRLHELALVCEYLDDR